MFIRRSTLPSLSLVPGAVVRFHAERVTLWPVSTTQETALTVEALPEGGYGVLANTGGDATLLAQYPSQRIARRQLRRLVGEGTGHWGRLLGGTVLAAFLLFLVWFLFFVPSDPAAIEMPSVATNPTPNITPIPVPRAVPSDDGPAFVDDPAERLQEAPANPMPKS